MRLLPSHRPGTEFGTHLTDLADMLLELLLEGATPQLDSEICSSGLASLLHLAALAEAGRHPLIVLR